jgi:nucleoside-diphosphate kinase
MQQTTFGMVKPGVARRRVAVEAAQQKLKEAGLRVLWWKTVHLTPDLARAMYSEHRGRVFYQRLMLFMRDEDVDVFAAEGEDAVSKWREIIGPTHRAVNAVMPGTLRGQFAQSDTRNAFHGSGSQEEALREMEIFTSVRSVRSSQ